jgi:hypothetical protein
MTVFAQFLIGPAIVALLVTFYHSYSILMLLIALFDTTSDL